MKVIGDKLRSIEEEKVIKKDPIIIKLRELKEGEKVSIISDTMFKTMLNNSKRIKYSAKLISYFVDVSYEELLKELRLVNNELDKENYYSKGERCDYIAEIDGVNINIEVNNKHLEYTVERNIEYLTKLYRKNIRVGSKYKYTKVIQINLNNFYYEKSKPIEIYTINNGEKKLTDKITIIEIYLPLIRKKWYNKEKLREEEKYLLSLYEMDIKNIKEIGEDELMDEYIEESKDAIYTVSFGESYDHELALKEASYEEGLEDGEEKGKKVGIKETSIKIAKKLLKENVDISIIEKTTGLSKEEIENIV